MFPCPPLPVSLMSRTPYASPRPRSIGSMRRQSPSGMAFSKVKPRKHPRKGLGIATSHLKPGYSFISHFSNRFSPLLLLHAITVGVAEECETSSTRIMAAAPERTHEIAMTTKSNHVTAVVPETYHVVAVITDPIYATAGVPETVHVAAAALKSIHAAVAISDPVYVSSGLPESRHVSADLPEPRHISADLPEPRHISADLPEPRHVSVALPEPRHVSEDLPKPRHFSADLSEPRHIMAVTPESHLVAVVIPQHVIKHQRLASSVEDPVLVSVRTAGIPRPTHFSPLAPELIPLSAKLPIMGVALWCIWAAYTTTESPEVVAYAAEPPEVAALASAPCVVVVSSDALSANELSS
ncbi:hypothetical protein DPX16_17603 [Anabarilius grahami]|uniref:Uncharacterized protein n=1 Tax=Anabarilius grahami TaxID=495550 RepID=A0A3N0Y155_ANAGA|nr:hypothetical protein DPX16_17603 [Anabarilius grahami]